MLSVICLDALQGINLLSHWHISPVRVEHAIACEGSIGPTCRRCHRPGGYGYELVLTTYIHLY